MTRLHDLYEQQGQSPWLDNLRRDFLTGGTLERFLENGIRGITSNPTIFANAIENEPDYDEQFEELLKGHTIEESYWELVIKDITDALEMLKGLHRIVRRDRRLRLARGGSCLAHDTAGTVEMARHAPRADQSSEPPRKNPRHRRGCPRIRTMIGEGRNINVTLLFSLERYTEVVEAYLSGLEEWLQMAETDLSGVASVASFFVSRVDTEIDRRLENLATEESDADKRGKVASFARSGGGRPGTRGVSDLRGAFQRARWEALKAEGARPQRLLWASTSTKNPAYPDLLYVDSLIGPETVNTMPDATVEAFLDHGTVKRTVDTHGDEPRRNWQSSASSESTSPT